MRIDDDYRILPRHWKVIPAATPADGIQRAIDNPELVPGSVLAQIDLASGLASTYEWFVDHPVPRRS